MRGFNRKGKKPLHKMKTILNKLEWHEVNIIGERIVLVKLKLDKNRAFIEAKLRS